MKTKTLFIILTILTILMMSCAPRDGNDISDKDSSSSNDVSGDSASGSDLPKKSTTSINAPSTTTDGNKITSENTFEVAQLLEKSQTISSYKYILDSFKGNFYTAYHLEEKVKKEYLSPIKFNKELYYDTVYLDENKKTAVGICQSKTVLCEGSFNRAFNLDYNTEKIELNPLGVIRGINHAKEVTTQTVNGRSAVILEYQNKRGQIEQLWVDDFYGFPLRQEIFSDNEEIIEKHTFSRIEVGNVKESKVTLPSKFSTIE